MSSSRDRSPGKQSNRPNVPDDAVDSDLFCAVEPRRSSSSSIRSRLKRLSFKKKKHENHREESRAEPSREFPQSSGFRKEKNCERCEQQAQEHIQKIRALEEAPEHLRRVLKQKEEELQQVRARVILVNQLSQENQRLKSDIKQIQSRFALEQKETELQRSRERILVKDLTRENHRLKAEVEQARSSRKAETCQRCEQQIQEHTQKTRALKEAYDEQLRFALEQKETELQRSRERMMLVNDLNRENHRLKSQMEQARSRNGTSKRQCCEHQAQEHRQIMCEMEQFYKDKLTEARSALKEKDQEFRSFKDRVAENMVLSLKTDNTENMNSPVNQSRLTEMYQQLRVCTWPNIKFTSPPHKARTLVREMFAAAAEHMKRPLETLEKVCAVKGPSPKVEKFRQTALENLQLALYHSSKEDVFQAVFPLFPGGAAEWDLASECFWLACLMELHCPPLHPHWGRADEDHRTVFPRDIRAQKGLRHRVTVL